MQTKSIEIRHVNLPMTRPFVTSFGTVTSRHIVVAKFTTDLGETYAESPTLAEPSYSPETTWTVMYMMQKHIGPMLLENDISSPEELQEKMHKIRGNNMAKHLVDTSMYHLLAQAGGIPLHEYLGGVKTEIEVGLSVGIKGSIEELLESVGNALERKFRRVKIKIMPGWDVVPVQAIRSKYGDIPLMADANSAYTLADTDTFKQMDQYNLIMVEQPLGEDDIIDHAVLQKLISTPICLDESIKSYDDARHAIELGSCQIINIKPGRVGGLYPAKRIHDLAYSRGIPVWIGGMMESSIGKLDNIALATLPGFKLPGDIDASQGYLKEDLIHPTYKIVNGLIAAPKGPGLGFEIDQKRLEKLTVEKVMVD